MFTPGKDFRSVDPRVRIGHVHLKVSDLERALQFYCEVLGFELMQRWGTKAAFVSAGGYHHHVGAEHAGKSRRFAASSGHDRFISPGNSLSRSRIARGRTSPIARRQDPARWRQ